MKRFIINIMSVLIVATILVGSFGHTVQAAEGVGGLGCLTNLNACIVDGIATAVNTALTVASWVLAISGFMLNFSINLTLHIKDFVDGTPAVFTVWKSIRDISGMFIIFLLLYAAIKMILGYDAKMGALIKTVVVAGILINFSFFITGLGIDVSNVVSIQLYNAIAPANTLTKDTELNATNVESLFKDGGISDIFMSALRITNIYDPQTGKLTSDAIGSGANGTNIGSASLKIILGGVVGIMIILTSAASFFLASLAFIIRFVILIFLLGFSPILFASFAIPKLSSYATEWKKTYISQLTFMPVYLLLMYFAMSILVKSNLYGTGYAGNLTNSSEWYMNFLVLGVNATIVTVMLNAPLVAALTLGAKMPGWAKNADALSMWKMVGGAAGGTVGRNTLGWAGSKTDKYLSNTRLGNTIIGRDIRSATIGKVAAGKYGGGRSFDETRKEQKSVDQKQKEMNRSNDIRTLIASGTATPDQYASIIKQMGEKERLALGKDTLKNPEILKNMKKSDFEAIKKSEDFTPEDVSDIKNARKAAFTSAVTTGEKDVVKHMVNNMDIEDIIQNEDLLKNNNLIEELTPDKLKKIAAEGIAEDTKHIIAKNILTWRTSPADPQHKSFGWMSKSQNHGEWLKSSITANGKTYNPA